MRKKSGISAPHESLTIENLSKNDCGLLLQQVDAFHRYTGQAHSTIGRRAIGDPNMYRELCAGLAGKSSFTVAKITRIRDYMKKELYGA